MDHTHGWYEAKIVAVDDSAKQTRVQIHYIGFADRYDVWVPLSLTVLRPVDSAEPDSAGAASAAGEGGDRLALLREVEELRAMCVSRFRRVLPSVLVISQDTLD